MKSFSFVLEPAPPFRLDLTVWALRRRSENRIDQWDGQRYSRILPLREDILEVEVTQSGPPQRPKLSVEVMGPEAGSSDQEFVTNVLERALGLHRDLTAFYALAESDPNLGLLSARFRGLKPPRFPTLFECLINAVANQQIALTLGIRLLNRLAETYGPSTSGTNGLAYALPGPDIISRLEPEALRALQFSRQKGRTLIAIAAAADELAALEELDDETARQRLLQFKGVGRWTAEYVLLRGLGRLNVFPADDVGARGGLKRWLGIEDALDYDHTRQILDKWLPYAGFVYFHLLLKSLAEQGLIPEG